MERNITDFVDTAKRYSGKTIVDGSDLYNAIKHENELIINLCKAVMNTYDNLEQARECLRKL